MPNKLIRYFVGLIFFVGIVSCHQEEAFYEFSSIQKNEWNKNHDISFVLDSSSIISNRNYTISLELSHNISYNYKNLFLLVDYTLQDSTVLSDTLECMLVNNQGRWKGSGNGSTRQLSIPYKVNFKIDTALHNEISVRHAMQDLNLKGIEKIGLKVY